MTVQFPAFCPHCGFIFQSRLIAIEGDVAGLIMEGNREACPRCGAWADLPDGTFNVVEDTIHVLSASGLTQERIRRLAAILQTAREGDITEEAATKAVAEEAPSLAPLIESLRPKMGAAFLSFLWAVVLMLSPQVLSEVRDDPPTRSDVQRAVEKAVQRCQEENP